MNGIGSPATWSGGSERKAGISSPSNDSYVTISGSVKLDRSIPWSSAAVSGCATLDAPALQN